MTQNNAASKPAPRSVDVTRVFDAPVALVWKAWTNPEHIMRWWGPEYFTSPYAKVDFREGGSTVVAMRSPDGTDFYSAWRYQKIIPMERIEYIQNMSDKDGATVDPVSLGLPPEFPKDVQTVLTFKALGNDKTEIHIVESGFVEGQMLEYAVIGMEQSLDKMAGIFAESKPA
jgi:uncharacterized protein YndB with AHSA1/START domain